VFYIVTAYHAEARPVIEYFNLKKVVKNSRFQIFAGSDVVLIESGPGIVASACAASFLLSEFKAEDKDAILNIGIAGAKNADLKIGDAVLCHKIIYHDTGRAFYPDILVKHAMKEGVLETFDFPVAKEDLPENSIEGDMVDMEGAGFFEAASFFMPPHKIHCIKVVSDYLEKVPVEPAFVSRLIGDNLSLIRDFMLSLESVDSFFPRELSREDREVIEKLAENLKLSFTMAHQLKNLALFYLSSHERLPEELFDFLNVRVNSKREGKNCFERVKKLLC